MAPTALVFESEASPSPHSTSTPTPRAQEWGHGHFALNQVPLTEVIEPLDFEDVLLSRPPEAEPGPLRDLVEFPADDLELLLQPRECRTTELGIPKDEWVPLCLPAPPPHLYLLLIKHPTVLNSNPASSVWPGEVTLPPSPPPSLCLPVSETGRRACPPHSSLEGLTRGPVSVYPDFILHRKLDAQVRAAVEMYTEDWIIAHRRWVWLGAAQGGGSRGQD